MIKFSEKTQIFFDDVLNYQDIPDDAISISDEEHIFALDKINSGHHVFIDLTFSERRPSEFHYWNNAEWIDPRTDEEKLIYKRSQYPTLTRYQFKRCLLENGYKSEAIEDQIIKIEDEMTRELTLLGFKEATNFVRTDDSILAMQSVLGLSEERVDELWEYALTL